MIKSIGERYKSARKFLGMTLKDIYEQTGVSSSMISRVETEKFDNPNYQHTKFLIEEGINPYYLIGKSDEIEGRRADINTEEHEALKQELEDLKVAYQKLEEKQEWLEKLLKIKIDEKGNIQQNHI